MSSFGYPINTIDFPPCHLDDGFHSNDESGMAPIISCPLTVIQKSKPEVGSESDPSVDLEIQCRVKAWPEPNCLWSKDGERVKIGDRFETRLHFEGTNDMQLDSPPFLSVVDHFKIALIIRGVTLEEEGVYRVTAKNKWGAVKSSINLTFNDGGCSKKQKRKRRKEKSGPDFQQQNDNMETTSKSPTVSMATQKYHMQQFFSFVVNGDDQLTIGLDKLNVIGQIVVTWLVDGKVVVNDNNPVTKDDEAESKEKANGELSGKYASKNIYSVEDGTCTSVKLYVNKADESDCCLYEAIIKGQSEEVKRKFEVTKDLLERLIFNRGSVLTKKKTVRAKKSDDVMSSSSPPLPKVTAINGQSLPQLIINGSIDEMSSLETTEKSKPKLPLQKSHDKKLHLSINGSSQMQRSKSPGCFPMIVFGGRAETSGDEDDDVVPDLPKIQSRISSRRNSVEEESLSDQISFLGQTNLGVYSPKDFPQRIRKDSESSDNSDPGDSPVIMDVKSPRVKTRRGQDLSAQDAVDENEPPPAYHRGRRMSAVDISKSTQQRLLRLSAAASSSEPPCTPDVAVCNPDMELFRQRRIFQQHSNSRRQSLAEIIPDWPTLDSVEKREIKELKTSSSTGKFEIPQRLVEVESFEMQQFERRRTSVMATRRRSLAEVIPDWPQLQKPKDLKVDFWRDGFEDMTARDEDSRAELSARFSKGNVKMRWFKGDMEIFHGEKYNFLLDDDGVVRLIIQRIGKEDEGRYTCHINDTSSSACLAVEEKEYNFVRGMPSSTTVKEKKSLILECLLNDLRPVVTWYRNGEQIEYTSGLYEISRRDNRCILKIPAITKLQDGVKFECSVYKDTTSCEVTVEDPEYEFIKGLTDLDCFEKDNVIFECQLNYDGAPVKWLKNGRVLKKLDGKFQKKVKLTQHRLVILNADQSDEADYSCVVQDKCSSGRLFVSPDVVILERLQPQSKLEHEKLFLRVKLKNPKHYVVKWFKNGKMVGEKLGERYSVNNRDEEMSTLSIDDLHLNDAGIYCCRIGNRETSARIQVEECQKPPWVDFVPKEIVVRAGKGIQLEIPYKGIPQPEAHWFKNGRELTTPITQNMFIQHTRDKCVMSIDKSVRADTGNYALVLKNICGELRVPVFVNVISVPSEPNGPLSVIDLHKDRCRLKWEEPSDKGGLSLTGYIVEAFDLTTMNSGPSVRVGLDTQCAVNGLIPGHKYKFKVKAVNQEGESAWLATDGEILAKDPWDPPSKPGTPEIKDYDKNLAEIQWKPSLSDGGSEILKYVIEKRLVSQEWMTVGMVPPTELDAIIPDLTEGEKYEFRVVAVNQAGRGEYSDPSEPIKIKATKLAAKIDHTSYESTLRVKAGHNFHLEIIYYGEPSPDVTWSNLNKNDIGKDDEHFRIRNSRNCSMLSCNGARRVHTSFYTVTVKNDHGMDQANISVTVIDVSDAPKGPLQVTDIRKSSAVLRWKHPDNTGGKDITNYIIEKKILGTNSWERLTQFVPGNSTEIKITKLKTGEAHLFRVAAENEIGMSDFLTTKGAVTIQNQFGRPDPPSKPNLLDNSTTSITICWKDGRNKNDKNFQLLGYTIERKNLKSQIGEWIALNENPVEDTTYKDDHLKPNSLFVYRIIAENEEGFSDPGLSSDIMSTLPLDEKPSINLLSIKDITAKKGQDIKVTIPFSANPLPTAEWKILRQNTEAFGAIVPRNKRFSIVGGRDQTSPSSKRRRHSISQMDGQLIIIKKQTSCTFEPGRSFEALEADGRIFCGVQDSNAILTIKNSSLYDTGIYKLKLTNKMGDCETTCRITVMSIPSAPEGPLEIIELISDSVTLQWKAPPCDGGSPILRYIVEKKFINRASKWTKVASNVKPQGRENRTTIRNLDIGVACDFKIYAVNDIGDGEELMTLEAVVPGSVKGAPAVMKNVKCTQISETAASLSWDDPKDAKVVGFVVEKKEKSFHYWNRVSGAVEQNVALLKHLSQGKEYDFRVAAMNHFGIGEFTEVSFSPQPMHMFACPKILLNSSSLNTSIHVGQKLSLKIPFAGFPRPELTVIDPSGIPLVDSKTTDDDRIKIEKCSDNEYLLFKPSIETTDSGTFRIHLASNLGGDEARINITVLSPPSPPQKPLRATNVKGTSYLLSWRPPMDNGGRSVTHYIVEAKEVGDKKWRSLNKYCRKTELLTEELDEGVKYEFKVSAANEVGVSGPLMSDEKLLVPASLDLPSTPDRPKVELDKAKKIKIHWTTSKQKNKNVIDEFIIESCRKGSSHWSTCGRISAHLGNQFEVGDIGKTGEYQFRVRGANRWGVGEPSLASSFVSIGDRKLPKFSGLITGIERLTSGKLRLDWNLPKGKEGLVLERRRLNSPREDDWLVLAEGQLSEKSVVIGEDHDDDGGYEYRVRIGNDDDYYDDVFGGSDDNDNSKNVRKKRTNLNRRTNAEETLLEKPGSKSVKEPQFTTPLENVNILLGDEAQIVAKIKGNPWPIIKWYLNGNPVSNHGRFSSTESKINGISKLVIKDSKSSDLGMIMCELSNFHGKATSYAKLILLEKPSFQQSLYELNLNKNDSHKLRIPFSGSTPHKFNLSIDDASYGKDEDYDEVDDDDDRNTNYQVEMTTPGENDDHVVLLIKKAQMSMNRKIYLLELANNLASAVCEIKINVKGPPSICKGALNINGLTKTTCLLSWKPPSFDGGSKILHYVVEKRDLDKPYWMSASPPTKIPQVEVQGLIESKSYIFRVAAVNPSGIGPYLSTTHSVTARLPFAKPEAPSKPTVVDSTFKNVTLEWFPSPATTFFDDFHSFLPIPSPESPLRLLSLSPPPSSSTSSSPPPFLESSSSPVTPQTTYIIEKTVVEGDDDDVEDDKLSYGSDNSEGITFVASGDDDRLKWTLATISGLKVPPNGDKCLCVVENLIEGRSYKFRVVPHNQAGQGNPSSASDVVIISSKTSIPFFLEPLSNLEILEGRSVELQVEIDGKPRPNITWYKGGQALVSTPSKYEMDDDDHVHTLIIKNISLDEADEYIVRATNELGSKTSRAHIVVNAPPKIQPTQLYHAPIVKDKGSSMNIRLYYTGYPSPHIEWTKDDEQINNSEVCIDEKQDEETYSNPAYESRQRRYSVNSRFLSNGLTTPTVFNSLHQSLSLEERRKFESTPRYVSMNLTNIQPADKGEYTLTLNNKHGLDQISIQIKVNDVPGQPKSLKASKVKDTSLTLTWEEPIDDGGSTVTQYFVEVIQDNLNDKWLPHSLTRFSHCNIENLQNKKKYQFRVGAINVFGRGSPCQPISVTTGGNEDEVSPLPTSTGKMDYDCYYTNLWKEELSGTSQPAPIKKEKLEDFYDVCEQLGSGPFGTINRVVEKSTGRSFICEFVNLLAGDDNDASKKRKLKKNKDLVMDEIDNMRKLHHRKIHHLHEVFHEGDDDHKMAVVMEFLSGDDLLKKLSNDEERFTEEGVAKFMRQVCEALQHMHEKNIVHLAIKPENLLCSTLKSSEVKVTNFGSSALLDPEKTVSIAKVAIDYQAPEVVEGRPIGFYSDMWSVGVVAYVLLTGKHPFEGRTTSEKMKKITECKWKMDSKKLQLSDAAKDFVANLLEKDTGMRMTVQEALDHPWLCQECTYSNKVLDATNYIALLKSSDDDDNKIDINPSVIAIGSLINSTSLIKCDEKKYKVEKHKFDRKEVQPRFVWKPKNCCAHEGSTASFKCKILSSDRLTVKWFKDSTQLDSSSKHLPNNTGDHFELRILKVTSSDGGEYVVRAENKYGRVEEAALLIMDGGKHNAKRTLAQRSQSLEPVSIVAKTPSLTKKSSIDTSPFQYGASDDINSKGKEPVFTFFLRDRTIQEGSGFKLTASVEGHPLPKITWYKDGRELFKSSLDYEISFSHGMCTLEVESAKVSQGGRYSCRASNVRGSSETSSNVIVYGGGSESRSSSSRESPMTSSSFSSLSSPSSSFCRPYSKRYSRCSIDRW